MQYIVGSAVEIFCEIPADKITGTTLILESLKDKNGIELSAGESLTFYTTPTNLASVVWQSAISSVIGKYTYIVKSANGSRENFSKGNFYLTEQ